jgi:hypothetical protein
MQEDEPVGSAGKVARCVCHIYPQMATGSPLCQDICRPDITENQGGENMRDRSGPIRTGIQEQGSGQAAAVRERPSR